MGKVGVTRMNSEKSKIIKLVKLQNEWRKNCLNLIASENAMSPFVERYYVSDFMHRYAEGLPFKRYYQGTRYADELEDKVNNLFKEHFNVGFVDCRPLSGTQANYAVFNGLGKRGDSAMTCGLLAGSHISHEKMGAMGILGYEIKHFAFDYKNYTIDAEKAKKVLSRSSPRFIILSGSVILFPPPVKELKEICERRGIKIVYDAAHIFGLITAGFFQDPFKEGADIITSSTHKTFPGPQGGIILGNPDEELRKKIQRSVFPGFVSNHHIHRLPALGLALLEMKKFGKDYVRQTIQNAKAMAEFLDERGFDVEAKQRGFTESHQVLVDVKKQGGGDKCAKILEKADIIVNKSFLPREDSDDVRFSGSGIRIGVQEMTRFGMKKKEMERIAGFMREVLLDGRSPEQIRKKVVSFRKDFQKMRYCFS